MSTAHTELVRHAIPLWHANVAWAKELLVRVFGLADPVDIGGESLRGRIHSIPGTCWHVRPHGIGVDIFKTPDVGGIDFDFNRPEPDEWFLAKFIVRQVNDGQLPYVLYGELIENEELLSRAVKAVLTPEDSIEPPPDGAAHVKR